MTRLLLTVIMAFVIFYSEGAVSSSPSDEDHPAKRVRMEQTYGIPTYADSAPDREKQDWITFFKRGHRMNESQVKEQIQTPEVLQAFERAKFSSMPGDVKKAYDDEDRQYDQYSQHTAEIASKGEAKGKAEGIAEGIAEGKAEGIAEGQKKATLKIARELKQMRMSTEQIATATGLSAAEVAAIKVDDQEL